MLQNLPSMVAAHVLAPRPGMAVIDMCAAPGGKATLLAQLMRDEGTLIALDRSHSKVDGWVGGWLSEQWACSVQRAQTWDDYSHLYLTLL